MPSFSVLSIFPTEGLSAGATIARIFGTGFQSGATVTVDGSRVDATVVSANTISVTMPAHAAGKIDVTVIGAPSQAKPGAPRKNSHAPAEAMWMTHAVWTRWEASRLQAKLTPAKIARNSVRVFAPVWPGTCPPWGYETSSSFSSHSSRCGFHHQRRRYCCRRLSCRTRRARH